MRVYPLANIIETAMSISRPVGTGQSSNARSVQLLGFPLSEPR